MTGLMQSLSYHVAPQLDFCSDVQQAATCWRTNGQFTSHHFLVSSL